MSNIPTYKFIFVVHGTDIHENNMEYIINEKSPIVSIVLSQQGE